MAFTPTDESEMGYTVDIRRFLGDKHGGREIMHRDQDPRGKVFYTTAGGEAIVVGPNKYPKVYQEWYAEFEDRARGAKKQTIFDKIFKKEVGPNPAGEVKRSLVLDSAFALVSEKMKYSKEGVADLLAHAGATHNGDKVELSDFMEAGVGVCRHQALALATLLFEAKDQGHIRGDISVDRSMQWSPDGDEGGHAWVRYTSHAGEVYILDVAQGFSGTLEASRMRPEGWNYLRPEDRALQQANEMGGAVAHQLVDRVPVFEQPATAVAA
jgi:hypothetical protein